MADRTFYDVETLGHNVKVIAFSFATNSTSEVNADSVRGEGVASVERDNAGIFVATLEDKYTSLVAGAATLQTASASELEAQLGSVDVSGDKTVVVRLVDKDGAATDLDANANNRVNVILVLDNSAS